jgi:hypothetical protein
MIVGDIFKTEGHNMNKDEVVKELIIQRERIITDIIIHGMSQSTDMALEKTDKLISDIFKTAGEV